MAGQKRNVELVDPHDDDDELSLIELAKRYKAEKAKGAAVKEQIRAQWQLAINDNQVLSLFENDTNDIGKMCCSWFLQSRNQDILITGKLLRAKAKEFAEQLGKSNFSPSDQWQQNWCLRHNIFAVKKPHGAPTINTENVKRFRQELPWLLCEYRRRDVFSVDESKIFFRALTNRRLFSGSFETPDSDVSKELLTILFCVNMAGEKENLFIVGSFEDLAIKASPKTWQSNKTASLTDDLMTEWLCRLDRNMVRQNRKILLFLNNTRSHCSDLKLENINVIVLPPDTASVCQPLKQAAINTFKGLYKDQILRLALQKVTSEKTATETSRTLDAVEALQFIRSAWKEINVKTVKRSFRKAGFQKTECKGYFEERAIARMTYFRKKLDSESEGETDMDSDAFRSFPVGLDRSEYLKLYGGNDLSTCEFLREYKQPFEWLD